MRLLVWLTTTVAIVAALLLGLRLLLPRVVKNPVASRSDDRHPGAGTVWSRNLRGTFRYE